MTNYYHTHISEAIEIDEEYIDYIKRNGDIIKSRRKVKICPECYKHNPTGKQHKQAGIHYAYDCKNIFYEWQDKDGNVIPKSEAYKYPDRVMSTVGQCCCYSFSHGVRISDEYDIKELIELLPHLSIEERIIVESRIGQYRKRGY